MKKNRTDKHKHPVRVSARSAERHDIWKAIKLVLTRLIIYLRKFSTPGADGRLLSIVGISLPHMDKAVKMHFLCCLIATKKRVYSKFK